MSKGNRRRKVGVVEVSVSAPDAKEVFVAGTFNNWNPKDLRLKRSSTDGQWIATLELPPGRHEYKFIVDGQWCCEFGCDRAFDGCAGCVPNTFGTMNRVVIVDEQLPETELAR